MVVLCMFQICIAHAILSNSHAAARYDAVMAELRGKVKVGRKLTRDEMNERRKLALRNFNHT